MFFFRILFSFAGTLAWIYQLYLSLDFRDFVGGQHKQDTVAWLMSIKPGIVLIRSCHTASTETPVPELPIELRLPA